MILFYAILLLLNESISENVKDLKYVKIEFPFHSETITKLLKIYFKTGTYFEYLSFSKEIFRERFCSFF